MKKSVASVATLVLSLGLFTGCTKSVPLRMAIEVVSEPAKADVKYHGKSIGETPADVDVKTFDDLESIIASKESLEIVEKRIRILSPEKAQLIFKLGKGQQSPVAKSLKLDHILIFDYSEKVAFDTNSFDLKPDALPILNTQAEILNTYFPKAAIHVCGYTDSTGGDDHNLKLSLKRAEAVSGYLLARGVAKDRIQTHGFGKEYAVDANTTPAGRALNRRTEVILPQ